MYSSLPLFNILNCTDLVVSNFKLELTPFKIGAIRLYGHYENKKNCYGAFYFPKISTICFYFIFFIFLLLYMYMIILTDKQSADSE